jgi:uncharacterized protein with PIN domain
MIVDTSALIAIVFKEPGNEELIHKLQNWQVSRYFMSVRISAKPT